MDGSALKPGRMGLRTRGMLNDVFRYEEAKIGNVLRLLSVYHMTDVLRYLGTEEEAEIVRRSASATAFSRTILPQLSGFPFRDYIYNGIVN